MAGSDEFGKNVFENCENLIGIYVSTGNQNYTDRNGVLFSKDMTTLFSYPGKRQGAYVVPDGVTTIGDHAFGYCNGLTSVTIPDSVTTIEAAAIWYCHSLKEVDIKGAIAEIDSSTFRHCVGLVSVSIPVSVTRIRNQAFTGCDSLTDVYYGGSEAQWKAIVIDNKYEFNASILSATIHYNSSMPNSAKPEKPVTAAELGLTVTGWAKAEVDKALAADLYDEALGKDMTVGITRAQAAAVAVKLYEAMNGEAMPEKENPFTDTEDPNVIKAYSLGLIDGNGSGRFGPDDPLNREAVAVMLAKVYRKLGGTIPPASATTFTDDGKISGWAKAEVSFMAEKGIVKGDGTSFNPQGPITGQEALILGLHMMNTLG